MGIPLDKAELLAIILESFAFAVFTVLCCLTLWVLLTKPSNGRASRISMFVLLSLYALTTAHWIIDILRAFEGFIDTAATPFGALAYFHHTSEVKHVVKTAIYSTETIVGDSYVIYRTWIVWERKWLVILFPSLLLVGTGFTGYGIAYSIANITPGGTIFTLQGWITSSLVLSVCTNSLCTGLIALRIWKSIMAIKSVSSNTAAPSRLLPFVMVVVESGALYCVAVFAALIVFLCGSNGQFPAIDLLPPITGITFTLIIVRVSLTSDIAASFTASRSQQRQIGTYPPYTGKWRSRHGLDLESGMESNQIPMAIVSVESPAHESYYGDVGFGQKSADLDPEAGSPTSPTPWASSEWSIKANKNCATLA